ncbi:MAG: VacB/RNase II family 3'-5' exoribonuclease [Verrucomicrobia bacterium]|nr:VacB/RNase II family 3'-5' exoribonuclease [Verrucomicrobiota bacterium]MBS0646459.1 VacB/RNase II family 3'-5' exoribonuclease [Verrucomicrobiota bacterium]
MTKPKKKQHKPSFDTLSGVLKVHVRGFGFLIPDDRKAYPEDVFIPKPYIAGAVDGDHVLVCLSPNRSERGPEGRVKKILQRGRSCLGGTVVAVYGKKGADAYSPLLGPDQLISLMPSQVTVGQRVLVEILKWGTKQKPPLGKVLEVLGHIDDPSCDVKAALAEYEITPSFSPESLEEAKSFGTRVRDKDRLGRIDYTAEETITIDPATAKDFDDALSLKKHADQYHLIVHIADVAHYVTPGSALNQEASARCNSVYFPGTVVPMLPHELSSHLCSLKPNVKRLAISVSMTLSAEGKLLDYSIARSIIKSAKRFSYEEARDVLQGKLKSPHLPLLQNMVELCRLLKHQRALRGSIEFALPDTVILVDEQGVPKGIQLVEYDITHQLVEEFMLKANEVVATHLYNLDKPLTYRIHEEPAEENIRDFAALASALGFKVPKQPTNEQLQQLFDEARDSPFGKFLATSFIRSMKLASYSTQNVGHYGLCLEHYTHFTSPIRRYIDLIVHRVLFSEVPLEEASLERIAAECSDKERLSAKAENSVLLIKKIRYLRSLVEKDPQRTFQGVITKVKPTGFSFELAECLIDGYISIHGLYFDEKTQQLKGRASFRTGDKIVVQLEEMDLVTLELRWSLCYKEKIE